MKTIATLIVTYNRLSDLKVCVSCIREQTHQPNAVYVINNGSNDGTDEWLAQQPDLTVVTQANLGGAGGFATGIERAYNDGYDEIWCMDDDCVPTPDALKNLVESPNIGPGIKNCVSINVKNHEELAFFVRQNNKDYQRVSDMDGYDLIYGVASLFNGTLISSEVIKAIGVPDKKLFIWGDEVEYMTRAMKNHFPVVTVPTSLLFHPPPSIGMASPGRARGKTTTASATNGACFRTPTATSTALSCLCSGR
ncbi:glycosyltransferase [Spirosoma rhododendri]|uniref:Glycosyltransferase n=1 Tax=Spirosoma rhododendri TaxID=2728024 RepID=A0A7L5DPX9_9BACT|nr:glycosyltransferase [Spirosoma rhododendri]QJD80456.1 glycosyltransferase [Spirosoma rhododendri]